MKNRFAQQTALITGGADGLGKGIALRIAAEGGRLALFDINQEFLDKAVAACEDLGAEVRGYRVDIGDEKEVRQKIGEVEAAFGGLDIMVNSAGIVGPTNTRITDYSVEEYDRNYRVNLRGSFLLTKYSIALMEKNRYGRILLIASIAGKEGNPFMCGYSSMKAGVMGLVKSIGKEYAGTGVTVNGLAPAVIATAMNSLTSPEQLAYMTARIPMKRMGTVEEVAALACWIVSRESSFTTGFVFDISGGRATY